MSKERTPQDAAEEADAYSPLLCSAPNPLAFSIPTFCKATSIGRSRAYSYINEGRLVARKLGKRTIITYADAKAFIDSLEVMPPGDL